MAALAVALIGIVTFAAACSDAGDDIAGPPIPTLDAAGIGPGIQTVAEGPLNAGCANCVEWSCATGVCGYDTANPPGACCTECDFGQPAVPKPSCEPGGGGGGGPVCSEQPGAGQYGVDFCNGLPGDWCPINVGEFCPAEWTCCWDGPYGEGVWPA